MLGLLQNILLLMVLQALLLPLSPLRVLLVTNSSSGRKYLLSHRVIGGSITEMQLFSTLEGSGCAGGCSSQADYGSHAGLFADCLGLGANGNPVSSTVFSGARA